MPCGLSRSGPPLARQIRYTYMLPKPPGQAPKALGGPRPLGGPRHRDGHGGHRVAAWQPRCCHVSCAKQPHSGSGSAAAKGQI
jgi:hypothetical protein